MAFVIKISIIGTEKEILVLPPWTRLVTMGNKQFSDCDNAVNKLLLLIHLKVKQDGKVRSLFYNQVRVQFLRRSDSFIIWVWLVKFY
jgi:hypothetical protein